jgi:hypothetical protein
LSLEGLEADMNTKLLMLVLVAGSQLLAADGLKLQVLGGRPVVGRVFINGNGPYRFLLDTGAQSNQIDAVLAGKIGLTPAFRVDLETAAGAIRVAGARVDDIALGSARVGNQEFLFTTLEGIHAISRDIQGVLGQEFLSRFDYRLDLHARTLDFDAPSPSGDRIPTERVSGRPTIVTNLGRLVLDSGSDTLVLFHSIGKGPASAGIRTASGFAAAVSTPGLRLRIGGRDYEPGQVAIISRPEAAEDGLMPLSLFKAVHISNSQSYIVLE